MRVQYPQCQRIDGRFFQDNIPPDPRRQRVQKLSPVHRLRPRLNLHPRIPRPNPVL